MHWRAALGGERGPGATGAPKGAARPKAKALDKYFATAGDTNTFMFLFVGKWEHRKGVQVLLRAFYSHFANDDSVCLTLVTSAYHSRDNFEKQIKRLLDKEELVGPHNDKLCVIVLSDVDQVIMGHVYSAASVLVNHSATLLDMPIHKCHGDHTYKCILID
jgi:glycosyltransferase involved in cell wall biosynthesis